MIIVLDNLLPNRCLRMDQTVIETTECGEKREKRLQNAFESLLNSMALISIINVSKHLHKFFVRGTDQTSLRCTMQRRVIRYHEHTECFRIYSPIHKDSLTMSGKVLNCIPKAIAKGADDRKTELPVKSFRKKTKARYIL